jgi:hypothetical protein
MGQTSTIKPKAFDTPMDRYRLIEPYLEGFGVVYHIICRILFTLFGVLLRVAYLSKRVTVVPTGMAARVTPSRGVEFGKFCQS